MTRLRGLCRHMALVLVVAACDIHTDLGKESEDTEGGSSSSGDTGTPEADQVPVDDDRGDGGDNDEEHAGECVGEPLACQRFEGEQACLQQDGCYPTRGCVGVEEDCSNYEYLSAECEAAPHCYSDVIPAQFGSLPGCWQYDIDCASAFADVEPCESYGGTCHETTVCEGDPSPCEHRSKSKCQAHMGCYWKAS